MTKKAPSKARRSGTPTPAPTPAMSPAVNVAPLLLPLLPEGVAVTVVVDPLLLLLPLPLPSLLVSSPEAVIVDVGAIVMAVLSPDTCDALKTRLFPATLLAMVKTPTLLLQSSLPLPQTKVLSRGLHGEIGIPAFVFSAHSQSSLLPHLAHSHGSKRTCSAHLRARRIVPALIRTAPTTHDTVPIAQAVVEAPGVGVAAGGGRAVAVAGDVGCFSFLVGIPALCGCAGEGEGGREGEKCGNKSTVDHIELRLWTTFETSLRQQR